jgi:molecular chaperone DnaJ
MLKPGARIRLQIRRGLSEEVSTVDLTLPQDYAAGKPVRLKGLGRRIGRWQGDLYLTLVAKH